MTTRLNMAELQPAAYKAMYGLETYLRTSSVTATHKDLIKIRASQINGCAFCLDMHTREALQHGETLRRIMLLDAWADSDLFTTEEGLILQFAEAITLVHQGGIPDALYQQAEQTFGAEYLAQVIMTVVTINAWNRIAISTRAALPINFS